MCNKFERQDNMKRLFFVDLENIGKTFIEGIHCLTAEDEVHIFHSAYFKSISPTIKDRLLSSSVGSYNIIETNVHTKNAMDFQICTFLGYKVHELGSTAEYYLISADQGYCSAIEFLEKNNTANIKIAQIRSFEEINLKQTTKKKVTETLGGYSKKVIRVVMEGLDVSKSVREYHIYLQRNLKKDGEAIFAKTRNICKEFLDVEADKSAKEKNYQENGITKAAKKANKTREICRREMAEEIFRTLVERKLLPEDVAREVTGV